MVTIVVGSGEASKRLSDGADQLRNARPLFKVLAGTLEAETEANFAAQGRPSWVPLKKSTLDARLKRNKGSSLLKILQDRGILASSISSGYGEDFAMVGAGGASKAYAGMQQFGGVVDHPAHSVKTRLRTDSKGELLRQGEKGRARNLAVFAKDGHKRARESWSTVQAYKAEIPARPYLPFSGPPEAPVLQPTAERSLLDAMASFLGKALG